MFSSEGDVVLNIITEWQTLQLSPLVEAGGSDVCQTGFFQKLRIVALVLSTVSKEE